MSSIRAWNSHVKGIWIELDLLDLIKIRFARFIAVV